MTHTLDICLASNKPKNLKDFLQSHGKKVGVRYWVVVDDEECRNICLEYGALPVENPRPDLKYYGLNHGYQKVFEQSNGEFFTIVTDEIRYPDGWYERLQSEFRKYVVGYPDRIFRLRVSDFRHKNYQGLMQCMAEPENYSIATREWYTVAEGIGEFWGPDSWHQCIEYIMGVIRDEFFPHGLRRGFPLEFFKVSGMDAGAGYEGAAKEERDNRIRTGWEYYVSKKYQERYLHLAYKLRTVALSARMKCPVRVDYSEENGVYIVSAPSNDSWLIIGTLNAKIPDVAAKLFEGFRELGEMLCLKPVIDEKLLRP